MPTMWTFKTKRFAVIWRIWPEENPDLSFDETGETQEKVASGEWTCFCSKMSVELDGIEIGCDYLGESIYANPADFRDHIGMNKRGHGSYFSDMVRAAIAEARTALRDAPKLRQKVA